MKTESPRAVLTAALVLAAMLAALVAHAPRTALTVWTSVARFTGRVVLERAWPVNDEAGEPARGLNGPGASG